MSSEDDQLSLLHDIAPVADEAIIRNAYEQALIRVARLASYGETGELLELSSDVTSRQTQLAIDDLIHLAISTRRLVDAVAIESSARNICVPTIKLNRVNNQISGFHISGEVPLRTVLNKIVHSTSIDILNFGFQAIGGLPSSEVYRQIINRHDHKIKPLCFVRADTKTALVFHVAGVCEAASQLLEIAADKASDSHIFLEDLFR